MSLSVAEMVELAAEMRRLGVEEFKAGAFAVRFLPKEDSRSTPVFGPPAIEHKLSLDSVPENDSYSEEDLFASAD